MPLILWSVLSTLMPLTEFLDPDCALPSPRFEGIWKMIISFISSFYISYSFSPCLSDKLLKTLITNCISPFPISVTTFVLSHCIKDCKWPWVKKNIHVVLWNTLYFCRKIQNLYDEVRMNLKMTYYCLLLWIQHHGHSTSCCAVTTH